MLFGRRMGEVDVLLLLLLLPWVVVRLLWVGRLVLWVGRLWVRV